MGHSMSHCIKQSDINYSLEHIGAQYCCAPKYLTQSSTEIPHPDCLFDTYMENQSKTK